MGVRVSTLPAVQDTWLDVCLQNVVPMLVACREMGVDPAPVLAALPEGVSPDPAALRKVWVTLGDFNRIMDALVDTLGHPDLMTDVGRFGAHRDVAYGGEAMKLWMLGAGLRYLTHPGVAFSSMAETAVMHNVNKSWTSLFDCKDGRGAWRVEFPNAPDGGPARSPDEDIVSLLYFIRGLVQAVAPLWAGQGDVGFFQWRVVDLVPATVLRRFLPDARVLLRDGVLTVDEEIHGRVVHLAKGTELEGEYLGDFTDEPTDDSVPGVLITRDVVSWSERASAMRPLLREGEVFATPGQRFGFSVFEARWRVSWLARGAARFLRRRIAEIQRISGRDADASTSQRQIATYERRLEIADQYLEKRFPTAAIARRVVNGRFRPMRLTTCVVLLDVCNFTVKSWQMQSAEMATRIRRFSSAMIDECERRGGWFYKFTGDGGIFVFTDGFASAVQGAPGPYCETAVLAARAMRERATEEFGWDLRIGVHLGDVTWYVLEEGFSFEGTGKGIDMAARMEKVANNGEIVASDELVAAVSRSDLFGEAREEVIKHDERVVAHPVTD